MKKVLPYVWIVLAAGAFALGFNWCYMPNGIAFGGLTGVAQIVHAALPRVPVGAAALVLNIPLFLLGWKLLGARTLIDSLFAMAVSSLAIDVLGAVHRFRPMDPLLASIYGGVLVGTSLGVIFQQGATTGGTDLAARLLRLALPGLPLGKLLLGVDLVVIAAASLVFRSLHSALYGLVSLCIASFMVDKVLDGVDTARVAYIITGRAAQTAAAIQRDMDRGVTILHGRGAWSGEERAVLLVAFKRRQLPRLKRAVRELDRAAFVIVCPAHEVLGDGFQAHG